MNDVAACRRALREIREIAAVALLDGALMTEQEALKTIGAIADWTADESPAQADCGEMVRRLDALIGPVDIDAIDDRSALDLFREVTALLQGQSPTNPHSAV